MIRVRAMSLSARGKHAGQEDHVHLDGVVSIMGTTRSPFSAAEQGLGYIYQARLALLKILGLPESTSVLIEKDDDLEFVTEAGAKSLTSLKHKAPGDTLTNLSTDFWKSVRIWLTPYLENGRIASDSRFFLLTTATVSNGSFLALFTEEVADQDERAKAAQEAIAKSQSQLIETIRNELTQLSEDELRDFYARVTIVDAEPRITDIPALIDRHLRTIRRESRGALFERLEGWWMDLVYFLKILFPTPS